MKDSRQAPAAAERPSTEGTPVSERLISHDLDALEAAMKRRPFVHWTRPQRDNYGQAWVALGTEFVPLEAENEA